MRAALRVRLAFAQTWLCEERRQAPRAISARISLRSGELACCAGTAAAANSRTSEAIREQQDLQDVAARGCRPYRDAEERNIRGCRVDVDQPSGFPARLL